MSASNEKAHHPSPAELLENNEKWAAAVKKADPDFFKRSAKGQFPKILWIGCSDSRVPESVISACRPGDIFVHRNIANQVHPNDTSVLSVIEYAVNYVKVEHVILSGHTECGGVNACLGAALAGSKVAVGTSPTDAPINQWLAPLHQLALTLKPTDNSALQALAVVEANVQRQVDNICETEIIQKSWAQASQNGGRAVQVHGWVHEIGSGELRDLGLTRDR
jgi:carbonic anhydrase